jgi:hypothetical protein
LPFWAAERLTTQGGGEGDDAGPWSG